MSISENVYKKNVISAKQCRVRLSRTSFRFHSTIVYYHYHSHRPLGPASWFLIEIINRENKIIISAQRRIICFNFNSVYIFHSFFLYLNIHIYIYIYSVMVAYVNSLYLCDTVYLFLCRINIFTYRYMLLNFIAIITFFHIDADINVEGIIFFLFFISHT